MESQENKRIIAYIISKLRSITRMVQLSPFVYAFFYTAIVGFYPFVSYESSRALDTLFYISPTVIIINLIESKILKLCKWHKTACLLPLIPQIIIFIDAHIVRFTTSAVYLCIGTFLVMLILFLISAYKVFFSNGTEGRKQDSIGNTRILQV